MTMAVSVKEGVEAQKVLYLGQEIAQLTDTVIDNYVVKFDNYDYSLLLCSCGWHVLYALTVFSSGRLCIT